MPKDETPLPTHAMHPDPFLDGPLRRRATGDYFPKPFTRMSKALRPTLESCDMDPVLQRAWDDMLDRYRWLNSRCTFFVPLGKPDQYAMNGRGPGTSRPMHNIQPLKHRLEDSTTSSSSLAWYDETDYVKAANNEPRSEAQGFTWHRQKGASRDRYLTNQFTGEPITEEEARSLGFAVRWQSAMLRMGMLPAGMPTIPTRQGFRRRCRGQQSKGKGRAEPTAQEPEGLACQPSTQQHQAEDCYGQLSQDRVGRPVAGLPLQPLTRRRQDYYNAQSGEVDKFRSRRASRPPPGFGFERVLIGYEAFEHWYTTAQRNSKLFGPGSVY